MDGISSGDFWRRLLDGFKQDLGGGSGANCGKGKIQGHEAALVQFGMK